MIKYPEFIAKGWPMGSSPTEATCKTLAHGSRASGIRWDADNAEALSGLEALTQKRPMGLVLEKSAKANGWRSPRRFCQTRTATGPDLKTDVAYRPGECLN